MGTWCHSSNVASADSRISARLSASESGSVHNSGHGNSKWYEKSGAKLLAIVLVMRSSCTKNEIWIMYAKLDINTALSQIVVPGAKTNF